MFMSDDTDQTLPPDHPWSPYADEPARGRATSADPGFVARLREQHVAALKRQKYLKPSALMRSIKAFDDATYRHCVRVSRLAVGIGERLGLGAVDIRALERAALVHDAGKLCVPDTILNKPGALDGDEWEIIKQHTLAGESIGFEATGDADLARLIRSHHERLDGTGYPDRLTDADIPLTVRALQVADIFDALTSDRAYKPAYPAARAVTMLEREVERGWRDPAVVAALVATLS